MSRARLWWSRSLLLTVLVLGALLLFTITVDDRGTQVWCIFWMFVLMIAGQTQVNAGRQPRK